MMNSRKSKCAFMAVSKILKNRRYSKTSSSSNSSNHYDIIIAGGGVVGTTLACTLGKNAILSNKRILLLEATKPYESKSWCMYYRNRVSSLNMQTYNLLNSIGAWKHIADTRFGQIKKLQVWDSISNAAISFNDVEFSETIAYVVENDLLLESVLKEIKTLPNVTIVNEAKIKSCGLQDRNSIVLQDDTNYTCTLLLGCDGINSKVRKSMGIQYMSWNYNQKGVVATVKLSEATNNIIAWQRFLPTGPVALLPLTDSLSSLVWSTTIDNANKLLELTDEHFVDALNEAIWKVYPSHDCVSSVTKSFDRFLNSCQLPSAKNKQLPPSIIGIEPNSRAAFPLGFGHATSYIGKGVALVGDAAHRIHPLAGQGVNLGFGDITVLNRILGDAIYSGYTLDSLQCLRQYETERQRHNVPTMLAVDGLHKLYNTDWTPVVLIRSLGLQLTHALNPLKKAIIAHAGQ